MPILDGEHAKVSVSANMPALWLQVALSTPAKHSDYYRSSGQLTGNLSEALARNTVPSAPEPLTHINCEKEQMFNIIPVC